MTDSDDLTAPMRPSALHAAPATDNWSREDARRYASIVTDPELADPDRSGMIKLAWAFIRLDQQFERLEKRVEALKLSAVDVETLASAAASRHFAHKWPQTTEALVRLLTSQRED